MFDKCLKNYKLLECFQDGIPYSVLVCFPIHIIIGK